MPHKWSKEDDIVAYYLYKFGGDSLLMTTKSISEYLGMSESSLKMRIGNFRAIDSDGGLQNYAKLSKAVFDEYKHLEQDEYMRIVKGILGT